MDTIGSIKDTTVRISPSEKLKEYVCSVEDAPNIPQTISEFIKHVNSDKNVNDSDSTDVDSKLSMKVNLLSVSDIKWLHGYLEKNRNEENPIYLHEIFEGSEIVLPENEIIERNPELEARCERLRKNQMNRDYRSMTKNVDNVRVTHPEETVAYQVKHLNKQLVAVGQFVISLGAGFMFGFLGVELMIGNLDFGFRLLLGVMCALIIALAEIYFLAKKLNEDLNIKDTVQLGGPSVYPKTKKIHND